MFIKLNFSTTKSAGQVHHLLHYLLQNPSITNVSQFVAAATPVFNSTTMSGFDAGTSEIIRTVNPVRTLSHMRKGTSAEIGAHTLEFSLQSLPSKKYYIQTSFDSSSAATFRISDAITGTTPFADRTSAPTTVNWASTDTGGDAISLITSPILADSLDAAIAVHSVFNVRTAWFYITDQCFILAYTLANGFTTGWPTSFGTSNIMGPLIFSQYQPFDAFMRPENNIVPVMFTSLFRGGGFNLASDISQIQNVLFTKPGTATASSTSFQILNGVDATPLAASSWTRLRSPVVSWGSGSRTNDQFALTAEALGSTTAIATPRYGRVLNTTTLTRYTSADRYGTGFAMLPLRWELSWYNLRGGNASALGEFYMFNGDYVSGDQFNFNGKTYMIWPTTNGFSQRVGLAVPKE